MTIKLYGNRGTRALRCYWVLEELEVPYEVQTIDFRAGDNRTPEYLKINPNGKVPALTDGDLALFESAAICAYLADKFPDKGLIPAAGTAERATHDQWMYFCMSALEQPLWSMAKHKFVLPKEHRLPEMRSVATYEFGRVSPIVARALEGRDYLMGDSLTVADIMVGQTLIWAQLIKAPIESEVLDAYITRLKQRPAFARANG